MAAAALDRGALRGRERSSPQQVQHRSGGGRRPASNQVVRGHEAAPRNYGTPQSQIDRAPDTHPGSRAPGHPQRARHDRRGVHGLGQDLDVHTSHGTRCAGGRGANASGLEGGSDWSHPLALARTRKADLRCHDGARQCARQRPFSRIARHAGHWRHGPFFGTPACQQRRRSHGRCHPRAADRSTQQEEAQPRSHALSLSGRGR
eukprot:Amastigsp_a843160_36.p3 type:complete len:204 gc:universal Amastigsp_a843160_36:417-1028(+)